jgi:SNF2 family DNA or RNA helicase
LPVNTKITNSEHHRSDSVTSNSEANICEKFSTIQAIESSTINPPPPTKTKQPRKSKPKNQTAKSTRNFEFEEETSEGKKTKHKYSCTFSDPYNIPKLVETKRFSKYEAFKLNIDAIKIRQSHQIDKLVAANVLQSKLVPYDFQMTIALKVINEMNSNAILADEVGLGKTIEAGLIMKELLLRGEIDSILIVSPKSLLSQWQTEMEEKFGETFAIANNHRLNFKTADRVICSHNLLARKYDEISCKNWDLVVVDEAHAFRNTHTKGRESLANLPKNHLLLLTATPICNKLTDIYSVVDLIEPGVFDSERLFISRFSDDTKNRVVKAEGAYQLRQTLRGVMCRTRREQTGVPFTKRYVDSRTLEPEESERLFFDKATEYLRDIYNNRFKTIEP